MEKKHPASEKHSSSHHDQESIPEPVVEFFSDMEVELLSEIDDFNKVIKYTFNSSSGEHEPIVYHMLVSYQVLGDKQDQAFISLFEFDIKTNCINPNNFIIVS